MSDHQVGVLSANLASVAVVCLADGPLLSPAAVDRVIAAWRAGAGEVVAASYGGRRGHPVALDRAVWGSVPDDGGRALDAVLVPCDDLGSPEDVDTPADLERVGLGGIVTPPQAGSISAGEGPEAPVTKPTDAS